LLIKGTVKHLSQTQRWICCSSSLFSSILQVLPWYHFLTIKENMAPFFERPWVFIYLYILGPSLGHASYISPKEFFCASFITCESAQKLWRSVCAPHVLDYYISFQRDSWIFLIGQIFELSCTMNFYRCLFHIGILNPKCD